MKMGMKKQTDKTDNTDNKQTKTCNRTNEEWDSLEKRYGKATMRAIDNPLQVHKKLMGVQKKIIKPLKEPLVLMQKTDGLSEWYDNATQGVYEYDGSEGKKKKIWLNKKFLSTMIWGDDAIRYYNCTEDSALPNGFDDKLNEAELTKILTVNSINHEQLKAERNLGKGENVKQILMGIAGLIATIGGIIIVANLFGIDILDKIFGGNEEIVKTVVQNITKNITELPATALP